MLLSIIIPAYNEEKRIGRTLSAIENFMAAEPYSYEIIVVNDGSSDNTKGAVTPFLSKNSESEKIRLINFPLNKGKGFAVGEGMLAAKGDKRLFMDADSSTSIEHVRPLLQCLNGGYDIAISSRRAPGAILRRPQSFIRESLGKLFGLLVNIILPLDIKDTQNGFKLFTAEAAEAVFSRQRIGRWAFDIEALIIGKKSGFKIKEVPIVWVNDPDSRVKLSGMFYSLIEMLTIRLNLWLGRYE